MTETKHEITQRKIRNGKRKQKERSQAKLWAKLSKTKNGFTAGDYFDIESITVDLIDNSDHGFTADGGDWSVATWPIPNSK